MNERAVRGIHQADDAVIDADRHFRGEIGEFVFIRKLLNLWSGVGRFRAPRKSCALRSGIRDEGPDKTVALFAGVTASVDAIDFQILIRGERRDGLALAVVNVKLPAVVGALEIFAIEFAAVQRHAAMWTGIAHDEGAAFAVSANDQRKLQQHRFVQLISVHMIGGQRAIPETGEHERVGRLALRKIEFGHWGRIVD